MKFGLNLYPDLDSMLDAIAAEWLTGGGANDAVHVMTAVAMAQWDFYARECISDWALDWAPADGSEPSHMERYSYTAADLAEAFARFPRRYLAGGL